jgi:multimeric flavodoxin WrbA
MKKAIIINLSPRKKGTSMMLANRCRNFLVDQDYGVEIIHLYSNLKDMKPILKAIRESQTILMTGPCYINTYPADTVYLLEEIQKHNEVLHGQNLYGIIQGGMPYVHTHESGLKMLEIFAQENSLSYKGGFVIGMGAILDGQPLDKLINGKKAEKGFSLFLEHLSKEENSSSTLYHDAQLKMPGMVCWLMAKAMNRKIDKFRREKGIEDQLKSPYEKLNHSQS